MNELELLALAAAARKRKVGRDYGPPAPPQTFGQKVYENIIGSGEVDTPGERIGQFLNDMGKSVGSGLARGAAGLADLPYTIPQLAVAGGAKVGEAVGAVPSGTAGQMLQDMRGMTAEGPSAAGALTRAAPGVMGYQPETTAGKYAQTVGEFLPAAGMGGGIPQMVAAGVGSEAAGQFAEGTKYEPYARIAGALAAPIAAKGVSSAVRTAISPHGGADPQRLRFAQQLADEGVPLTAGQKVGSESLRAQEATNPMMARMLANQGEKFTAAAMRRIGVEGTATPENIAKATKQIGSVFNDIAARNSVKITGKQVGDAGRAVLQYSESVGAAAKMPGNVLKRIAKAKEAGQMSGKEYLDISSRLGKLTKSSDPATREVAIALRNVLDDALQSSVSPQEAAKLALARQQYRDLLAIEKAVAGAGENAAYGVVSPAQLRNAVKVQGTRQYVQGKRDLGELARAGTATMKPVPNSGTAPRLMAALKAATPTFTGGGVGGGLGFAAGGPVGAGIGAAAGATYPILRNAMMASKAGQRYLGNQLVGPAPKGNIRSVIAALLAQSGSR